MIYQATSCPHGAQSISLNHTFNTVGQNEIQKQEQGKVVHYT